MAPEKLVTRNSGTKLIPLKWDNISGDYLITVKYISFRFYYGAFGNGNVTV